MKAREILNFMLTNYVSTEYAGIIEVEKGEDASQYFADLCDSTDFISDGEYFWFYSTNDNKDLDLKKFLSFSKDDPLLKFADYEFPTKDGWYILFKID